jgi:hypothetical protein
MLADALCAARALFNGADCRTFAVLLDSELLTEVLTTLDMENLRLLLETIRLRRPDPLEVWGMKPCAPGAHWWTVRIYVDAPFGVDRYWPKVECMRCWETAWSGGPCSSAAEAESEARMHVASPDDATGSPPTGG